MQSIFKRFFIIILLLGVFSQAGAQSTSVKGVVTNQDGQPAANVKVTVVENPSQNTVTGTEGEFTIEAEEGDHLLLEAGNRKRTIEVPAGQNAISATLSDKDSMVLNMGHGNTLTGRELTSSVEIVTGEELSSTSVTNPQNALYGKIPGLWVLQNSGAPSQRSPGMYIRGVSTMGSNNMLVLVNGFERPLSSLVVEEIESIKVLKDAAAKALYGQQGANGVILVETKRSAGEKTEFNFTLEQGLTQPKRVPEFLGAGSYATAVNEAMANDGLQPKYTGADIERYNSGDLPMFYPNVDWVDEVLGSNGQSKKFNFNAGGGTEKVDYFVNVAYQGEEGFYSHTDANPNFSSQIDYDQVNIRSNGSMQVSSSTEVEADLGMMIQNFQHPGQPDILGAAYDIPSNAIPVKNIDGSWGGSNLYGNNPVARLEDTGFVLNNRRDVSLTGRLTQQLDNITEGLSATFKVGFDNRVEAVEGKSKGFTYKDFDPIHAFNGDIIDTTVTSFGTETDLSPFRGIGDIHVNSSNIEARTNYSGNFGNSSIDAVVLFRQQSERIDVTNDTFRWQNIAGNVHYGLKDTYFFDFTLSYQGSNRIQDTEDRWGLFPAVSGSWLVSNEDFLSGSETVSKLKLRASWGITGNGYIPIQNRTSPRYTGSGGYYFGNNNIFSWGFRQSFLGIPMKTFEKSYETNIGLETELFNKLTVNGDVFYAKRKDILVSSGGTISDMVGIDTGQRPDGIVENKGFELAAEWSDHTGDFFYSLGGQLSFVENKIVNQNEEFRPYSYLKREGELNGQQFGLQVDGFFQDEADIANSPTQSFGEVKPGDIKYVDQNGDGVINQFDEVPIGNSWFPSTYFSADFGVGYKGFELSAAVQGVSQRSVVTAWSDIYWPLVDNGNMSTWYDNYWTPENAANAELPRLTTEQNNNNFRMNDLWQQDGSFIKLRFVELAYSLPANLISKVSLNKAVVYLRGRNLYTVDTIDYADPENIQTSYPSIRAFNLGLKVQF